MTPKPIFRSTLTQAFADTVIDELRSDDGAVDSCRPADTATLPEVGDVVGGSYRLMRVLGKGNFGQVYVAERVDVPEHQVALKVMVREMYSGRDVERELVMLAAASHPNMVQLKDHGVGPGFVWFTMPVYEGQTLAKRLQQGPLSLTEAHDYFVPLAHSLSALHRAGLRHQDLKPDNIFLADFGGRIYPIILDLGVAAEKSSRFIAGTLLFAAPEQTAALIEHDDTVNLSEKIDTYGLASTLLLSLVGMSMFPGSNAGSHHEMREAQLRRAKEPLYDECLPGLTGKPRAMLSQALCRWFAIEPEKRPTMDEMAEQLDVLLEQQREEQQIEERRQSQQRVKLMRARAVMLVFVAVAAVVALYGYSKRETLQLATQLEEARAEQAVSFDSLQTCQGVQQLTRQELSTCKKERSDNQSEYRKSLLEVSRARDESTNAAATCVAQLKSCEEESHSAAAAATVERERLLVESESRLLAMQSQRDEQSMLAEARAQQLEAANRTAMRCINDLSICRTGVTNRATVDDNPYVDSTRSSSGSTEVSSTSDKTSSSSSTPASGAPVSTDEQLVTWD